MALASVTAAWSQFDANLAYWESATKAKLLLEACLYLRAHEPEAQSVAGRSYSRGQFDDLIAECRNLVRADTANTDQPLFARVRVTQTGADE